jgi:hypothetical protein
MGHVELEHPSDAAVSQEISSIEEARGESGLRPHCVVHASPPGEEMHFGRLLCVEGQRPFAEHVLPRF